RWARVKPVARVALVTVLVLALFLVAFPQAASASSFPPGLSAGSPANLSAPAQLTAGIFDGILGNRARMIQAGTLIMALGILILWWRR
ncbi:MAG: hypothetical protein L0099_13165, partial [Acidobacteria bacterium]|nr:hypothetical protein [Acidobacteriota bacterium]